MGSSKKRKDKDRKKHRKRSRSRSREREKRHKKRHHYDTEEFVPVKRSKELQVEDLVSIKKSKEPSDLDDVLAKKSREALEFDFVSAKSRESLELDTLIKQEPLDITEDDDSLPEASGENLSLGISETNKLRAKLGLKPLEVTEEVKIPGLGDESSTVAEKREVFVKTENIAYKQEAEKLKQKIATQKEKRQIQAKLSKVKGLGDSDSDEESAAHWVVKSRKIQDEKEMAEKRAKLLEEMDKEFGVGALIEEEFNAKNKSEKVYSARDLKGLEVGHSLDTFQEGRKVILTLRDKGVLEEKDDVLENVNLIDDEKAAKNAENRLKKPDYKAYDEPEYDEFGIVKKKNLLYKYDDEIHGPKKENFVIGAPNADRQKELELIRMRLKQQQGTTLEGPQLKLASEYYTEEEMVQFKKPKKRVRKMRKKGPLKPEELLPLAGENVLSDHGSRKSSTKSAKERNRRRSIEEELYLDESSLPTEMDIDNDENDNDILGPEEDLTGIPVDEDKADLELQVALNKARKLKFH